MACVLFKHLVRLLPNSKIHLTVTYTLCLLGQALSPNVTEMLSISFSCCQSPLLSLIPHPRLHNLPPFPAFAPCLTSSAASPRPSSSVLPRDPSLISHGSLSSMAPMSQPKPRMVQPRYMRFRRHGLEKEMCALRDYLLRTVPIR